MNALVNPTDPNPAHSNDALAAAAAAALAPEAIAATTEQADDTKKDKKKKKKLLKKLLKKERDELRAQMDAAHPRVDATPFTDLTKTPDEPKLAPGLPVQEWLVPVSRTMDNHRILTANKSSFMIAINCLMLAIAAHTIVRAGGAGTLWWVLIPMALTNVLSLTFAILSSQIREKPTALDELWAMPPDEYEPALTAMLQNKERVYGTLTNELHLHGTALGHARKHLRTAYNVLLGGIVLSGCTFVLCLALGTRP
jgi:hypothetical protein